jgi:hypothetical protein
MALDTRPYATLFAASAQAGAIDWFELANTSASGIALLDLDIGQTTELGDAAEEQIDWYIKRGAGSYTSGSGGNTGVARTALRPGDSAATFTCETLNTTRIAVGTGTLVTLHNSTFNLRSGLLKTWTPELVPVAATSQALAIGMTGAPADSVTWVGTVFVGELLP